VGTDHGNSNTESDAILMNLKYAVTEHDIRFERVLRQMLLTKEEEIILRSVWADARA
jgi:hypothetical protein